MKKLSYLLSIAGHALVLLVVLSVRFNVTIRPGPNRVVVVRVAEPPPAYIAEGAPAGTPPASRSTAPGKGMAANGTAAGGTGSARPGRGPSRGTLPLTTAGKFSLRASIPGSFRLAPVGKSPEPWAVPIGPGRLPGLQRFSPGSFRPGGAPGGDAGPGGVFLLPFDIRERAVADWTEAVLSRVERNWIIPASGRLAFSGRVQITLTIERRGGQRSLVVDEATVPDALTQAALHAVQASLPLPPIPENVAGDALAFTFVFAYNG